MLVEQSRLFALQVFLLCFVMRGYGSRLWSLAYTGALFVSSHKGPKLCGLEMQYYKLFFVFFFFALRVHSPSKGAVYNLMLCVQYGVWFCLCVSCPAVPFFFCLFCFVNVEAKLYFLSLYMVLGAFVGQRNRSSRAPNVAFSRIAVRHGYSVTFPTFGRGSFVSMPCLF